jgi:S-DNA-T family DNA segregation ATPase FtsK/SpoIIIE
MSAQDLDLAPALVECSGPHEGRRHPVPVGGHVIGRGEGASVALDDADVSRRHARLEVLPDRMVIEDLGSKNGIVIDGAPVAGTRALRHGERILVGGVTLQVDHPAAHVDSVLAAGGETTMTRHFEPARAPATERGLLIPVLAVLVFGVLVAVLLAFG